MRGVTGFVVLALSLAACRQTVAIDLSAVDAGGAGGGGAGGDGGPSVCSGPPTAFELQSPKVMVLLDRSERMTGPFGSSTALAVTREALDQYASKYQNFVWFGYSDFPGSTCSPSQTCCVGAFSAPNPTLSGFSMALHWCDKNQSCANPTGSQRPTAAPLYTCLNIFNQPELVWRYILLITNGRPDCGFGPGAGSCGDGADTQYVISKLRGNEVSTFVIAPGPIDFETVQCLGDLAVAGGTAIQSSYFHPAQDPQDLNNEIGDTLRTIARDACTLDLKEVHIQESMHVAVTWKNTSIPRDKTNGWDLTDSGYTITLHGTSCDRLVDGGPADFAVFPDCDPARR
jgi:hypothetical protein